MVGSFAILMWETFTEKIPYDGWAPLKIASDVAYQARRPDMNVTLLPPIAALIEHCWAEKPDKRS